MGDTLSILGVLEYFQDKTQINVHKMRVVEDINEELLQYQQTDAAQRCYFDPTQPFKRRLFDNAWQRNQIEQNKQFAAQGKRGKDGPAEVGGIEGMAKAGEGENNKDVLLYSRKRIMKNMNNYILTEHEKLTVPRTMAVDQRASDQGDGGKTSDNQQLIKKSDLLACVQLLEKAKEELKFCEDRSVTPASLIADCLEELEAQGFLNLMEGESAEHMYQIKDQRDKLKEFISQLLQDNQSKSGKGMNFDQIYKAVAAKFKNFFTKDPVFKAIDELFQ